MPNMIMVQDIDSTNANNLTHLITQFACVTPQSAHNKALKSGTSESLVTDKTRSLHQKLRRCAGDVM